MNRVRVLFSLTLLVAAASLASAGSFAPRASAVTADGVVCEDGTICVVDVSACPLGPDCCPMPCAPDAATTVAAR